MKKFPKLNLPEFNFKIVKDGSDFVIFDPIRKGNFIVTPEEWVRQNFIQFLVENHDYPKNLIGVEVGLRYNKMLRRADIVVYNKKGEPFLIVECKAPVVNLNQNVFNQVAQYNHVLKVPFLIVTNGLSHYCCKIDHKKNDFQFLDHVPNYQELNSLNNG